MVLFHRITLMQHFLLNVLSVLDTRGLALVSGISQSSSGHDQLIVKFYHLLYHLNQGKETNSRLYSKKYEIDRHLYCQDFVIQTCNLIFLLVQNLHQKEILLPI